MANDQGLTQATRNPFPFRIPVRLNPIYRYFSTRHTLGISQLANRTSGGFPNFTRRCFIVTYFDLYCRRNFDIICVEKTPTATTRRPRDSRRFRSPCLTQRFLLPSETTRLPRFFDTTLPIHPSTHSYFPPCPSPLLQTLSSPPRAAASKSAWRRTRTGTKCISPDLRR